MQFLPEKRQTVFFSATFPDSIEVLSRRLQNNPVRIQIEESQNEVASRRRQIVYEFEGDAKIPLLMRVLQQHPSQSTLIFCNQKSTVAEIAKVLVQQGVNCAALHGDLEQRDRDRVMALFRNGSHRILLATDVAARGLDIHQLELVINFDIPEQPETYIHRIGRTGRAGRSGVAVTLSKPSGGLKLFAIEKCGGFKFERPPLGFKNQHGLGAAHREAPMQTLWISGGRKDKLRPGDILGALTGAAGGLAAPDIGKIEIQDHFSYVAVAAPLAATAVVKLREGKIKGHKFQVKLLSNVVK